MEEYLAHVAKTGNALFVQNEIESVELSEASEENSESVEGAIADKEAEKVSITKVSDEFRCEICDFTTNLRKGLDILLSPHLIHQDYYYHRHFHFPNINLIPNLLSRFVFIFKVME